MYGSTGLKHRKACRLRKDKRVKEMNEMIRKRNEQLAKTVIKGLQSRNMSGYYAEDKEAALKQALELIPEGSTIAMGGCMSAGEIGLISALEAGNYHYIDRSKMDARAGLMPTPSPVTVLWSISTAIPTVSPA